MIANSIALREEYSVTDRPTDHIETTEDRASASLDRRKVLGFVSAGALATSAWLISDPVLARHGSDDDDNSGRGNGDDYDDDDNSGHGGGEDDDHGSDDDDDDDDHGMQGPVVETTSVEIVDERYKPSRIRIRTGDTVTWRNLDDDDHTASAAGMETGTIHRGDSGKVRFLEPGEFIYHCNFHPEMTGSIEVVGESLATPESATPEASPIADVPSAVEVRIIDFGFDPAEIDIQSGGTVTWTNTGAVPHSIFATDVQSEVLGAGDTFVWTAGEPGAIEYMCGIHPSMTGTIRVREKSA